MPRLNVCRLPRAQTKYRRAVREAIEAGAEAQQEDALRVRQLRAEADNGSWLIDPSERCIALADKLDRAATGVAVPKTLASKTFMRTQRLKLGSSLYQLVDQVAEATTFTVVSYRWTIFADCFPYIHPRTILNGVRSDLIRCGIDLSDGGVFMALDGEFERNRTLYQLHVNGVAIGSAIAALDDLRDLEKYRRVEHFSSFRLPIYRPVVVRRLPLTNLAGSLPYQLKSYWPSSWLPMDGSTPRSRTDQRIPEPYHSQWLLWMDQWSLTDLTLLMGMFVGAEGLTLTNGGERS